MLAVPAVTPITLPDASTEATRVLLLDHTPPGVASVNVMNAPAHKLPAPPIGAAVGTVLIVTGYIATPAPQAPETVYFTVSIPANAPVTTPTDEMLALVLVMLHAPPPTVSDIGMVLPTHTPVGPEIAPDAGVSGLIVIAYSATALPQLLCYGIVNVSINTGRTTPDCTGKTNRYHRIVECTPHPIGSRIL